MLATLVKRVRAAIDPRKWHFPQRSLQMAKVNWHLGLTCFGGPAVHFQIFHKLFVEKLNWVSDQMYQEMFALCQALPGPASTKLLFGINSLQFGLLSGILAFFLWSLPGALAAYGLAAGIAQIGQQLPDPVYAVLSGLNAATVGIVLFAGVQLSQKGITDTLSRILVFFGATAGLLYNTLWYFPVIMIASGLVALVHDYRWVHRPLKSIMLRFQRGRHESDTSVAPEEGRISTVSAPNSEGDLQTLPSASTIRTSNAQNASPIAAEAPISQSNTEEVEEERRVPPEALTLKLLSWRTGIGILIVFVASFVLIVTLRQNLDSDLVSRGYALFANMFLAGTIIFGGGPVVIPLLREYVVAEGWVSPRDFLLGLAIVQAFPGPNFNFAVYLGALAVKGTSFHPVTGALLAYSGIFTPGLILYVGTMGVWNTLRSRRWLKSCLRGVNAGAIGLVYTAVYRLWRIGYLDSANQQGSSLDQDPWWVVITATSFFGSMWFKLPAPIVVLLGVVMGLVWYGIAKA